MTLSDRGAFGVRRIGGVIVTLATLWPSVAADAAPLLAQAGAAIVTSDVNKAAKPVNPVANLPGAKMAENFANAPAGGAAPAPAAPAAAGGTASWGVGAGLMKYAPSYVLMALSISLGTFIICRPRWRTAAK